MQRYLSFPRLNMVLPPKAVKGFASLLQHGILFPAEQPVALVPFLLSLPGFTAPYIETTVQTIFIDGVAADSLDRELVNGSTLALSAAMPGLAGAIFRRQGVHGSLRSQPGAKANSSPSNNGFITLKLFNSIAADRVLDLIPTGVLVTGKAFYDFSAQRACLFQSPTALLLDGQPLEYLELLRVVAEFQVLVVQASLLPEH